MDARLRDPLPCASPPEKLRVAVEVLGRVQRGHRSAGVVPPRRARALVFAEAARASDGAVAALSRVADSLGVTVDDLRESLFADLPGERLVGAPGPPVSAMELLYGATSRWFSGSCSTRPLSGSTWRGTRECWSAIRSGVD